MPAMIVGVFGWKELRGKVWESEGERKENEKEFFFPTFWVYSLPVGGNL